MLPAASSHLQLCLLAAASIVGNKTASSRWQLSALEGCCMLRLALWQEGCEGWCCAAQLLARLEALEETVKALKRAEAPSTSSQGAGREGLTTKA